MELTALYFVVLRSLLLLPLPMIPWFDYFSCVLLCQMKRWNREAAPGGLHLRTVSLPGKLFWRGATLVACPKKPTVEESEKVKTKATKRMPKISDEQAWILAWAYLLTQMDCLRRPPSARNLAKSAGLSIGNVCALWGKLVESGCISHVAHQYAHAEITDSGQHAAVAWINKHEDRFPSWIIDEYKAQSEQITDD